MTTVMAAPLHEATDEHQPLLIAVIGAERAIDAETAQPLADELDRAVDAGAACLIVDLSRVESIGTLGLNALLRARNRMLARGGNMATVLPPRLRHLFRVLRLDRRFLLATSRVQALELVGLGGPRRPRRPAPAPWARAA
jgi:anti-anti-sigma factor